MMNRSLSHPPLHPKYQRISEVERLERSVQAAQNFLETLKAKMEERSQSPDAQRWIQEIGKRPDPLTKMF